MMIRSLVFAVGLAAALSPTPAFAQSDWTGTVSVFGGGSALPTFGANLVDPALGAKLDVRDRKIKSAPVVGGAISVWHGVGRSAARVGIRGDVSYQPAHADAQVNPATGTLLGRPYDGPLLVPQIDGAVTSVTGALLLGWDRGRVMPYAGAGAGALHATANTATASDANTAASWTGIAGMAVRLSTRVSAHAEYRYTVVEPTIVLGTQTVVFRIKPSQVVSGVSLAF
jgi:opacity protein-like surface antigen